MLAWLKGRLSCWRGQHDFRKPHKAEDQSQKVCKRCAKARPIRKRKQEEA